MNKRVLAPINPLDVLDAHLKAQNQADRDRVFASPFDGDPDPKCPTCGGATVDGQCLGICTAIVQTVRCECGVTFETRTKEMDCPACAAKTIRAWAATTPRHERTRHDHRWDAKRRQQRREIGR